MRIPELYQSNDFGLSFEIFPPKTAGGDASLIRTLQRLAPWQPGFISCTYGAGGSTRDRTIDWCQQIIDRFHLPATAHFTCVGSGREDLVDWLKRARAAGIPNIMALRGDAPGDDDEFRPVEGGLRYANELVTLIREGFPEFGLGVAGYPEKHPEATDEDTDLENLKRKVGSGGDAVFTQLFYVNENFYRFRDRCAGTGIDVPIVPGIMPITEFARIKRITAMCGAVFPDDLASRLEAVQDDKTAQFEIGVSYAIEQCRDLIDRGIPGIHFYVLNRSKAVEGILEALGFARSDTDNSDTDNSDTGQ